MVATDDDTQYVDRGGPSVTVMVPQAQNGPTNTGFIEVAAQAKIGEEQGAVALFEDGSLMPIQNETCQDLVGPVGPPLFVSPDPGPPGGATWSTPASIDTFANLCANSGPASPVLVTTTPGQHTYSLRYFFCGCDPPPAQAEFSERELWVTPLG
jgi:hypothetical protein